MQTVVIVIHLMIVATLIGAVLLQKSEGGGLGPATPAPPLSQGGGILDSLKKADERQQSAPAPSGPQAPRSQ